MIECGLVKVLNKVTNDILSNSLEVVEVIDEKDGSKIYPKVLVLYDGFVCPIWSGNEAEIRPIILKNGVLVLTKDAMLTISKINNIKKFIDDWNKYGNTQMLFLWEQVRS